jgi:hypothetical protein
MNENNNIFGESNNTNNQNELFQQQMPQQPVQQPVVETQQPVEQQQVPREGLSRIEIPEEYLKRQEQNTQSELAANPTTPAAGTTNENTAGPMLFMSVFNGAAILGIIYAYLNVNKMIIAALATFVVEFKEKKGM